MVAVVEEEAGVVMEGVSRETKLKCKVFSLLAGVLRLAEVQSRKFLDRLNYLLFIALNSCIIQILILNGFFRSFYCD